MMRRHLIHVVCLMFCLIASRPITAQANTVTISFGTSSTWSNGFQGAVTITNNAAWTIVDWTLEFDMPHPITSIWDASILSHVGNHYALRAVQASWEDGDLSPGESKTFGFVATTSGSITLPVTGTLNGAAVSLNGTSAAPPLPAPVAAPHWPAHVFAPYVDATAWPPFDLVSPMQNVGVRFWTLAFVVANGAVNGTPSWGGYYDVSSGYLLNEINQVRAHGGDVMVSFGGAAGTELAASHTTVATLQAAYQSVIDAYGLTHIDFDIEGAWVAHPTSIQRRSQAIAGLQAAAAAAGKTLDVWYTLPVLPSGLTADGVNVLQSALTYGVQIRGVNIMAMDYGASSAPNPIGQMGSYAIQAANSLFAQLTALYAQNGIPRTAAQIWSMVGVTPMIGQNDVSGEIFYQSDASQLLAYATQQKFGFLSFWSATRDVQCAGGTSPWASSTCSGILQTPYEFTQILLPFTDIDWTNLGFSLAGSQGAPVLSAHGALMGQSPLQIVVTNAAAFRQAWLVVGAFPVNLTVVGGTLVPSPDIIVSATTSLSGSFSLGATWPVGVPQGFGLHLQAVIYDPSAPQTYAFSNALLGVVP